MIDGLLGYAVAIAEQRADFSPAGDLEIDGQSDQAHRDNDADPQVAGLCG